MLSDADHEVRAKGIGGSDIAAIMGLSQFKTPLDVYLSKVEGWRAEETADMMRGTYLERAVLDWYERVFDPRPFTRGGTVHRPDYGPVVFTPDAIAWELLVEVKCPRSGAGWGEPGTAEIPEEYLLQVQWGMHALDVLKAEVVALIHGDMKIYKVRADPDLQADLLSFAADWWARHVVAKVPPPIEASEGAKWWLKKRFPRDENPMRPATMREDLRMLDLQVAEREASRWFLEVATIKNELRESIGLAAGIEGPAGRITYRANKNGVRTFKTTWREQ